MDNPYNVDPLKVEYPDLQKQADYGMHGLGAVVGAIQKLDVSSTRLGRKMLYLTVAVIGLTVVQVWLAFRNAGVP